MPTGRTLKLDVVGDDVRALHTILVLLELHVPHAERHEHRFGEGTQDAVCRVQERCRLQPTGVVDDVTAEAMARAIEDSTYIVEGTVTSPDRAVGGLRVQIVDKELTKLVPVAHAVTDDLGRYRAQFSGRLVAAQCKGTPDLQALVHAGRERVGASKVRYNAGRHERLDVELPAHSAALPSEYESLTWAIAAHYTGAVGELQETGERSDLTFLANKTGWDARLIAMAAIADRLSETHSRAIGPALFYALFRAGLSTEPDRLFEVDPGSLAELWKRSIAEGVIPAVLQATIPAAVEAFAKLVARHVLDARSTKGASTIRELAKVSLGDDEERQRRFAEIYTRHRADRPAFWKAVRESFGPELTGRLQLDGSLGELTQDNAPLIARLHKVEERGISRMSDLASRGYYSAAKWRELVAETPVPETTPGDTVEAKRANYAEALAAQVKLRFPTAVLAAQVREGEVPLARTALNVREKVHGFLAAHQDTFEIGKQPIEQYVVRNNLGNQVDPDVTDEIKRVQRIYQITPSDAAMTGLLGKNIHSAYQIARFDEAEFVRGFADDVGGAEQARAVYARAQEVHSAVLNIASHYVLARTAPQVGVHSPGQIINQTPGGSGNAPNDLVAYPTLERLFGSMDYCSCDHCRSILSPAAYLVDLLTFIDRTPLNQQSSNPQHVLFARRPDIQHLKLSCENTNTPLPYIDVVNETLEYFVANVVKNGAASLANYAGHDTGSDALSEDLLASPQFVDDTTYDALRAAVFPMPLPFNKPLETLRRYFAKLGTSLATAMEVMRADDSLDAAAPDDYAWRDILIERLGMSREEYRLLTDRAITVRRLYGYADDDLDDSVPSDLANIVQLSRRAGISYGELVEILGTRFINPSRALIPRVEALGVPLSTLRALHLGNLAAVDFGKLLPRGLDPTLWGGDATSIASDGSNYDTVLGGLVKDWLATNETYERLTALITISNPTDSQNLCAVDALELRYADPDPAANGLRAIDYVRLLRFVRLWRKLGWTIEQTDAALEALFPTVPPGSTELERLDAGMQIAIARLGIVKQLIDVLNIDVAKELRQLLTCWSPIAPSLYRAMFLNPTTRKPDPVFAENAFGEALVVQPGAPVPMAHEHVETLRAAFALTGDEIAFIVKELVRDANAATPAPNPPLTDETLPLSLENISAIFRRGWLARKLRLSVLELLLLSEHAGLDPFAAPDPVRPPIVQLVDLVESLRTTGLKPAHALYLIWNQDLAGKSAPPEHQILELASTLRATFAAIERDFAVVDDPDGDIARSRIALVYGASAADFLFGLLQQTVLVSVPYASPPAPSAQVLVTASKGRLVYDDLAKRLVFSGYLDAGSVAALTNAASGRAELLQAIADLDAAHEAIVRPFFARFPELEPLIVAYFAAATMPAETRRATMLASILPDLVRRRKREQALAAVSAAARADVGYAAAVLDDPAVLEATSAGSAALTDFIALESDPDAAIAGSWTGYVQPTQNGIHAFEVIAPASVTGVSLTIGSLDAQMTSSAAGTWTNGVPVPLTAGRLVAFELTITGTGPVTVRWRTGGNGWQSIPAEHAYAAPLVQALRTTFTRYLKAYSLAAASKLTPKELAYLASRGAALIGARPWLNALPVETDASPSTAVALRDRLLALLEVSRLKRALSPDDERLLAVLDDPGATLPSGESSLLTLTGWNESSLTATVTHLGKTVADLRDVATFARIHDAFVLLRKLGISAPTLLAATTNHPDPVGSSARVVRDFEGALRARFDSATWRNVIRPINDELRMLRRDALVAFVLQRFRRDAVTASIDTPDKLFEYFLMDVQMDSCMQTSRIRHALSSVQLFIERCFMNLERSVEPSLLDGKRWEWMRRYRVWEANRKVFLWPENWLEPELRDHQSSIFKETVGELLQSDITEQAAAVAMQSYLAKLEEIAKLEPCGLHYIDDNNVHVVARTSGAHRKYFYRRKEDGVWLPWEQIKLEIEDNPIVPYVWNGRLLLFWLKLITKGSLSTNVPATQNGQLTELRTWSFGAPPRVTVHAVLCWSEYFDGKWQPAKTSDLERPAAIRMKPANKVKEFNPGTFDRLQLRIGVAPETDALRISIQTPRAHDEGVLWTSFLFYNTHGLPSPEDEAPTPATIDVTNRRFLAVTNKRLEIVFFDDDEPSRQSLLESHHPSRAMAVEPWHSLGSWDAPFLFADGRHVFYVTAETSSEAVTESTVPFGRRDILKRVDELIRMEPVRVMHRVGDPVRVEPALTEDAYITHSLAAPGVVRFGNVRIGATGALETTENVIR